MKMQDFSIWVTRSGQKIPVKEMSDSHLENTIAYLKNRIEKCQIGMANDNIVISQVWSIRKASSEAWIKHLALEIDSRQKQDHCAVCLAPVLEERFV